MILSTGGKRMGPADFARALGQPAALCGIASGFFFALTAIAQAAGLVLVAGGVVLALLGAL